ncbi:RNA-binding domain-containing protein, partial [Ramicandelaber brevisporus]
LFVKNLGFSVTDETLREFFGKYGEIAGARIATDRDSGRSRGFGYIDFATAEAAQAALAAEGAELEGRNIHVEITAARKGQHDKGSREGSQAPGEPTKVLFVGNLSFNTTEQGLRDAFSECGAVVQVRLPTFPDTGRPKGFAHVEFDTVEAAKKAMEWNNTDLDGRTIRLDYASSRGGAGNGDAGGRGGRGGRGGARGGGRGGRGGAGG